MGRFRLGYGKGNNAKKNGAGLTCPTRRTQTYEQGRCQLIGRVQDQALTELAAVAGGPRATAASLANDKIVHRVAKPLTQQGFFMSLWSDSYMP
jgi:hypothetical protein